MRASDADREQAVSALREHLLAGRLTLEEFSERVGVALSARSGAELAQVREDLPEVFAEPPGSRRRPARFTAALFSHVARSGRQRLRGWTCAASAMGDLDLDLREATIDRPRTAVTVLAVLGNVDIYVPEGVDVDVGGIAIFGHRRDWGRDAASPDAPVVHVRALGLIGTIDVWRVPRDMRDSTYSEVLRRLHPRRQLPASPAAQD